MTKSFSKFLFTIILFLVFPVVSFAQISKIVFITDPQTIKPGEISGEIEIQFQDSNGKVQPVGETLKLLLQSSSDSVTKEFLNDSGKPVSTTVNSNWTGRTFYYRDSSQGIFTITVGIEGKEWTATQQITVSSGTSQNSSDNNSSEEVLGASTGSSPSSQSTGGGTTDRVSSSNAQLEIIAGNDRITSPGSPIWFQATAKKNTTPASVDLSWSFGDGNIGIGPLVSHLYKYPGDYVVVLSSRAGDIFSVSRLKVRVVESDILVSDKGKYLEILNNSNSEINLFNWKIENEGKGFVFQPNTIILSHSSIKLDKSLLTMKGYDNSLGTSLKNSLKEEVFAIAPVKYIDLNEASKNLETIKKEALAIQEKARDLGFISQNNNLNTQSATVLSPKPKILVEDEAVAAESVENVIYEVPKSEGFISKLTNFIKRVFSN